jgi:predicted lipid-binding transport protein (Tim44 family)
MRLRLALLTGLLIFVPAASARAAAGGGSSGFGGGGGGGGGGGFGGGGGGFGGGGAGGGSPVFLLLIFAVVLIVFTLGAYRAWRIRKQRAARVRQVELASAVAADDDPAFAADAVQAAARELFVDVQRAWDARDLARLSQLAGPDLIEEWRRRLEDYRRRGWHNRVEVLGEPQIQYVGLVNRAEDADDRVVVCITSTMRDYVEMPGGRLMYRDGAKSDTVSSMEWWTLAKPEGRWRLESIEQSVEGMHNVAGEIVTTPWDDERRLREAAVAERATAEAAPAGFAVSELADLDFDGTARAAALDLALADGRFDPDLIEASVRRAVDAWAPAVDGDDAALAAAARPGALAQLLHPGDASRQTRLVVRGPRIDAVRIADLDAAAQPPSIAVELDVTGRRYVEDRDTAAVLSGSRGAERSFTEHWTLALDGTGDWPWRIAATGVPAG